MFDRWFYSRSLIWSGFFVLLGFGTPWIGELMEGTALASLNGEIAAEGRMDGAMDQCYRLFNRQRSIHQIIGGGNGTSYLFIFRSNSWLIIAKTVSTQLFWGMNFSDTDFYWRNRGSNYLVFRPSIWSMLVTWIGSWLMLGGAGFPRVSRVFLCAILVNFDTYCSVEESFTWWVISFAGLV